MNEIFIIHVIDLLGLDDFALVEKFEGDVFSGFFVFGNFFYSVKRNFLNEYLFLINSHFFHFVPI